MTSIAVLIAAAAMQAGLSSAATAAPFDATPGVVTNSMWEYMGAMAHARCLVAKMKVLPADQNALRASSQRAAQDCRSSFMAGAKLNAMPWPEPLMLEARAMLPKVEADLLPVFERLAPSAQATVDRVRIMVANGNGETFDTLTNTDADLHPPMRVYAAFQSAAAPAPITAADLSRMLSLGRYNTTTDHRGMLIECKVTKSSGDAELDRSVCEIARACIKEHEGSKEGALSCSDTRQEQFLHDLAARRSGAISKSETNAPN